MKKRWFVVILTIGLLLCVLPPSVLALSPDPTITDADGNILGWSDLSTVPYSLDDLQEQRLAVVDEKPGTAAAPGLWETGSEKSLADADSERLAVVDAKSGTAAAPGLSQTGLENSLADEDRDEATADDLNPTPQPLDEEPDPANDTGSTTPPDACKIGDTTYSTLNEAISKAMPGDQIDLLRDIEVNNTGLTFDGKTLTISGGGRYTLTLNVKGIYSKSSDITFKDLTLTICAHTNFSGAGGANLITNSSILRLSHVKFELTEDQLSGPGIFLEDDSDLYFEDNTYAVIHGFKAEKASGIYAERYSNNDHGIWVTSSYLEVTDCNWNGMTIDPINLTLDNAGVYFTRNGTSGSGGPGRFGYGGLGCYGVGEFGGTLTMKSSTLTSTGNYGGPDGIGIYVGVLDMDDASTLYATDNQGSGISIGNSRGTESHICGQVFCTGNGTERWPGGGGFVVHAQHDDHTYEGNVTIEPGAYIYACNNKGLAGVLNNWILNIESGATVIVDDNEQFGLGNSFDARTTIKSGANVYANNNQFGIYNYAGAGDMSKDNESKGTGSFLIEGGAYVTANNNTYYGICNTVNNRTYGSFDDHGNYIYNPENDHFTIQGSADVSADGNGLYGIFNNGGIFTIENGANISTCNNDYYGILNYKHGTFTMEIGANVSVCNNRSAGIFNTKSGIFNVERNVDLQVEYNMNSGIVNNDHATLTLLSGRVRYNTTSRYGGGLRNHSTATLSDDVQLYNNHAAIGGDDIESGDDIENGGSATITFGPTGRGWELDGAPDCYDFITGWYDDSQNARWRVHVDNEDARHAELVKPVTSYTGALSLKAAHGSLSTGSLTVRKETTGELLPSDYDTAFTFELTLDDDTITTIDDQWCGVPFKNGKASFTLKSGESITLSNLPAGIGYTITEAAQDNWTLMNINDAETGVVPQNDTAEVVFTNLKNSLDLPDVPILPILPIEPEEPEIPEEPEKPQTPEVPEEPKGPETPKESEEPEIPEEPEQPQTSEVPEEPEGPETPKETEETKVPAQNTTAETLIQTGTTDWLAAVLLISGFGLLVCGWFFNRKQRAAKH